MSTYAIGDVQGCYEPLQRLLDKIAFDPSRDQLWFTGDLVNRGPDSLQTLRYVKGLNKNAITVLGNHDLHLLASAEGVRSKDKGDSLSEVLQAQDRDELLEWLRQQPIMHHDEDLGFSMIHAGLPPQWNLDDSLSYAHELQTVLRAPDYLEFLQNMYGNKPDQWSSELQGMDRLRFITNCFTRLRFCRTDGSLCLKSKGPPGSQPEDCAPWFQIKNRASKDMNILFGHWSALGIHQEKGIFSLDSGCLWGHQLTALRLEDLQYFSIQCDEYKKIG
jgi:bis(5'-nucleosyl)-tetraphosphatase (symmetrical)